jgi:DNA-binding winged helix-turn-helix (wHTH) protein
VLDGPHLPSVAVVPGDGVPREIVPVGTELYAHVGDGDQEVCDPVPRSELERWEVRLPAFLDLLASENGLSGDRRELPSGLWRLGRGHVPRGPHAEFLFVPIRKYEVLNLVLVEAWRALGQVRTWALLAAPHHLSAAAVAELTRQSIGLLDLSERLRPDLRIDWRGMSGEEPPDDDADLVICRSTHEVRYRGVAVPLPPRAFDVLWFFAQQESRGFVHGSKLPPNVLGHSDQQALTDCVCRVHEAFRAVAAEQQWPDAGELRILENQPRVGYRLAIPPDRVRVLG